MAKPSMFKAATLGNKSGSAYGACHLTTPCAMSSSSPALSNEVQPPKELSPVAESTKIQAKTPINQAPTSKANSAERRVDTR